MKLDMYPPPGEPSRPPTWEDIERLALHYAVVHRAVSLVRRGELTKEEALIHVAFALAGAFQQLFQREVERKMTEVVPMMLMERPSPPGITPWEEQAQATIANMAADLTELRSERQREHDRRVLCQADADTLGTALASMGHRTMVAEAKLALENQIAVDSAGKLGKAHKALNVMTTERDRLRERFAEQNKGLVAMAEERDLLRDVVVRLREELRALKQRDL